MPQAEQQHEGFGMSERSERMENTPPCTCSTDRALMREWATNLRQKARLIRKGVGGMADSCDDLARIIEEYVKRTSNAGGQHRMAGTTKEDRP